MKEKHLSIYATKDSEAVRLHPDTVDFRTSFFRDVDRIINLPTFQGKELKVTLKRNGKELETYS